MKGTLLRWLVRVLMTWRFAILAPVSTQDAAMSLATPDSARAVQDPAIYCRQQGGVVRERAPMLGANDPSGRLQLAGSRQFCEFTGGAGAEPAESWIAIDLDSLMAAKPTLATLAYLTTPPMPAMTTPGANPASLYCAHLGGSELMGGGWVAGEGDIETDALQACVFPDGSIIDSWGIAYHTGGTIRGADLAPILHYQPASPPLVFPGQ